MFWKWSMRLTSHMHRYILYNYMCPAFRRCHLGKYRRFSKCTTPLRPASMDRRIEGEGGTLLYSLGPACTHLNHLTDLDLTASNQTNQASLQYDSLHMATFSLTWPTMSIHGWYVTGICIHIYIYIYIYIYMYIVCDRSGRRTYGQTDRQTGSQTY